jgi:hypothetical protein
MILGPLTKIPLYLFLKNFIRHSKVKKSAQALFLRMTHETHVTCHFQRYKYWENPQADYHPLDLLLEEEPFKKKKKKYLKMLQNGTIDVMTEELGSILKGNNLNVCFVVGPFYNWNAMKNVWQKNIHNANFAFEMALSTHTRAFVLAP